MKIYDRRQDKVETPWVSATLSMIRCDEDMHVVNKVGEGTGEAAIRDNDGDGQWETFWVGHAALAGRVLRYAASLLRRGKSIEELMDISCDWPRR